MSNNVLPSFYSNFMDETPLLTREEEKKLSKDVLGKSEIKRKKAIEKLVSCNIRLAVKIALRDFGWHSDKQDLVSEAIMGLHKAASKYDANFGAKFSFYAAFYIRQYIQSYITKANLVRMSSGTNVLYYQIQRTANLLADELGYEPSTEEIAKRMKIKEKKVENILNCKFSYVALDSPFDQENGGRTIADIIADENAIQPDKEAEKSCNLKEVQWFFEGLKPREQFILKKRFGLDQEEPMILEDIGKMLNITRERTRQIQEIALKKIKKNLKKREESKNKI